jgi:periplasmic protein TonB
MTTSPPSVRARISSRPPPPVGIVVATRDPMARVLDLGSKATKYIAVGLVFALFVHGTAAARTAMIPLDLIHWTHDVRAMVHDKLWATYEVDMFKAPEDKPPAPEPEPAKEEEKAPPPVALPKDAPVPKDEPPPPAPAPAQAGQVLTAPDEPLDFTGQGFTQGTSATYAGGVTHAQGTSTTAVRNVGARPDGAPGGTGTAPAAPAPPTVDKSRAAGLRGSSEWKCPWPGEADAEQVDEAYVTVQVAVGPDGRAKTVTVMSDPGHGFGREARLCAMRETYTTALGQTKAFRIHFER